MEELSAKHREFVNEYLACFNATDAYLKVYSKVKNDTARANSSRLLTNANIQAAITSRLDERRMSADEVLDRLTDIARGDIADVLDIGSMGFSLDLKKAYEGGKTKLIKKLKQKTTIIIGQY